MLKRSALFLGGLAVAVTGCSKRTLPSNGELLVLISSDMQVPDSFDALVIQLDNEPANVRHVYLPGTDGRSRWSRLAENPEGLEEDCLPKIGDQLSVELSVPTTLGLQSSRASATDTQLTVTACKSGRKLLTASIPVTVPGEGEIRTLRLPLRWLCASKGNDSTLGCYSCDSIRCYGKSIHPDDSATSKCRVDSCDTPTEAYPTIAYDAEESARFHDGARGKCFDVLTCFSATALATPTGPQSMPLAVDWRERPTNDTSTRLLQCIARIDDNQLELDTLNLALVLPPGTQGTCTNTHCLVALEADSPLGYRVNTKREGELLLPNAVCHMLDSGQVISVIASTACALRTTDIPVCGTGNQVVTVDDGSSTYSTALVAAQRFGYRFDERSSLSKTYVDDSGSNDLGVERPTNAAKVAPRVDGVSGFGQTFDSENYGKSQLPLDLPKEYTLSMWLAVPERVFSKVYPEPLRLPEPAYLPNIPILSSISSDCDSGLKLELLRCADERSVQVAYATPTGRLDDGRCTLHWRYATFASKSWGGGYFSPFKRGDYRHLTLVESADETPVFYLDGIETNATDVACNVKNPISTYSDDSFLFVGSSKARVDNDSAPTTAPIELDELSLYDRVLTQDEIRWLAASVSTDPGPGRLYWGAWATQGGRANIESISFHKVTVDFDDLPLSSGGLFANLAPEERPGVYASNGHRDLSEYDEAVLTANIPEGAPFQFALTADHGRRQCTWQLNGSMAPYYVINLRQPSWCVDPSCSFDLTQVERVSIGTDWTSSSTDYTSFSVSTLAFRKRLLLAQDQSPGTPKRVGGLPGPGGFCWRAVSYYPEYSVRLANEGTGLTLIRSANPSAATIELAADLPAYDGSRSARDFSQCPRIFVRTLEALAPAPFHFALTNERGQTWSWPLAPVDGRGLYAVTLDASGTGWPTGTEATSVLPTPATSLEVSQHAVRFSLRYEGNFHVNAVQCCTATDEHCVELGDTVPPVSSTLSP